MVPPRRRLQDRQLQVITCPDHHRCYNGAPCVEHPDNEGGYACDCLSIVVGEDTDHSQHQTMYDGLACEHAATSYCTVDNQVSTVHYCTNQGTCLQLFQNDSDKPGEHAGCDCPTGYAGTHCQYVENQMIPDDWPDVGASTPLAEASTAAASANSSSKQTATVAATVSLGLVVLGVLVSFVLLRQRRKLGNSSNHMASSTTPAPDQESLEADGALLKQAVAEKENQAAHAPKEGNIYCEKENNLLPLSSAVEII